MHMYILVSTHAKKSQEMFVFKREVATRDLLPQQSMILVKINLVSPVTCSLSGLLPADYNRPSKELE